MIRVEVHTLKFLTLNNVVMSVLMVMVVNSDFIPTYGFVSTQIMLKGEKLSAILHVFLPNGQLLFINHKLMKQLEKNLDNILSVKM